MRRPVPLGDEPRVGELVERTLLEADRERAQRPARLVGRERGEHARVDAAREEHADGHVADEVRAHGVAQPRAELLDELGLVLASRLDRRRRPREAAQLDAAVPHEHVTRRQLARAREDRERRRHGVEREEPFERVEVDVTARQRAQLRRELEAVVLDAVVERLDPVAVAREHEPALASVPDRDREHAAQPLRERQAPLLVRVRDHLGVAVRAEAVAGARELVRELRVVVDLAVLHDDDASVLVRDRLVAGVEVDDREAPRGEPDRAVDERAVRVGAAVNERRAHRREPLGIRGASGGRDSANPAHACLPY